MFPMVEEVTVRIRDVLILLEKSSTIELLNFGWNWRILEVVIVLLLFSGIFEYLVWAQVVRKLPEAVMITGSKAPLNEIFFFVRVVVEH